MQVFGPVLYMDVQKTGSTFVTEFLSHQVRYAHESTKKHSRLMRPKRPEEVALLTSRDPVGTWLSLYNYGCTGVGRVRRRLDRRKVGQRFYQGTPEDFDAWIEHLTSAEGVDDLGEDYSSLAHLGVGFATFRELVLSFDRPLKRFAEITSISQLQDIYLADRMLDVRVRHSSLNADLIAACEGPLARHLRTGADPAGYLAAADRINASDRRVRTDEVIDRTRERILEAEALWLWMDEQWPGAA